MRKFAQKYSLVLFIIAVIPLTTFLGIATLLTETTNGVTVFIQLLLLLIQITSAIIYFKYN